MLTDKQIADALDLIDDRYHGVITKYLQKVGKTISQIGHLNQSSINLLIQKTAHLKHIARQYFSLFANLILKSPHAFTAFENLIKNKKTDLKL